MTLDRATLDTLESMAQEIRALKAAVRDLRAIEKAVVLSSFSDYATGTFTPIFASSNNDGSWTYGTQIGRYTRIGNRVLFTITVSAATRPGVPTGNALIGGLPLTSVNVTNSHASIDVSTYGTVDLLATTKQLGARVIPNSTTIEFVENQDNGAVSNLPATSWAATSIIRASGHYEV